MMIYGVIIFSRIGSRAPLAVFVRVIQTAKSNVLTRNSADLAFAPLIMRWYVVFIFTAAAITASVAYVASVASIATIASIRAAGYSCYFCQRR